MRDLNIDELEQVYGAGCWNPCGWGSPPSPPSCGGGSKSKNTRCGSKSKRSKKKSKSKKHSMKCW